MKKWFYLLPLILAACTVNAQVVGGGIMNPGVTSGTLTSELNNKVNRTGGDTCSGDYNFTNGVLYADQIGSSNDPVPIAYIDDLITSTNTVYVLIDGELVPLLTVDVVAGVTQLVFEVQTVTSTNVIIITNAQATVTQQELADQISQALSTNGTIITYNQGTNTGTQIPNYSQVQEMITAGTGGISVVWGAIGGTLADQSDLNTALNGKLTNNQESAVAFLNDLTVKGTNLNEAISVNVDAIIDVGSNLILTNNDLIVRYVAADGTLSNALVTMLVNTNNDLVIRYTAADTTTLNSANNYTDGETTGMITNNQQSAVVFGGDVQVPSIPIAPDSTTTRQYVDNKLSRSVVYYTKLSTTSDVSGYFEMSELPSGSNQTSITASSVTQNQYVVQFITPTNVPSLTEMQSSIYDFHIYMSKTGVGDVSVKAELYLLTAGGATVFEVDDTLSKALTTDIIDYDFSLVLTTNAVTTTNNRWGVKIKVTSVGTPTPDVIIYTEGATEGFLQGNIGVSEEVDPKWTVESNQYVRATVITNTILDELNALKSGAVTNNQTSAVTLQNSLTVLGTNVTESIDANADAIADNVSNLILTNNDLIVRYTAADTIISNALDSTIVATNNDLVIRFRAEDTIVSNALTSALIATNNDLVIRFTSADTTLSNALVSIISLENTGMITNNNQGDVSFSAGFDANSVSGTVVEAGTFYGSASGLTDLPESGGAWWTNKPDTELLFAATNHPGPNGTNYIVGSVDKTNITWTATTSTTGGVGYLYINGNDISIGTPSDTDTQFTNTINVTVPLTISGDPTSGNNTIGASSAIVTNNQEAAMVFNGSVTVLGTNVTEAIDANADGVADNTTLINTVDGHTTSNADDIVNLNNRITDNVFSSYYTDGIQSVEEGVGWFSVVSVSYIAPTTGTYFIEVDASYNNQYFSVPPLNATNRVMTNSSMHGIAMPLDALVLDAWFVEPQPDFEMYMVEGTTNTISLDFYCGTSGKSNAVINPSITIQLKGN